MIWVAVVSSSMASKPMAWAPSATPSMRWPRPRSRGAAGSLRDRMDRHRGRVRHRRGGDRRSLHTARRIDRRAGIEAAQAHAGTSRAGSLTSRRCSRAARTAICAIWMRSAIRLPPRRADSRQVIHAGRRAEGDQGSRVSRRAGAVVGRRARASRPCGAGGAWGGRRRRSARRRLSRRRRHAGGWAGADFRAKPS